MSVSRAIRAGAATLATIGLVAACSSGGPTGTGPSPSAPAPASSKGSGGAGEAPRVPTPLKVDRISANPCDSLSADQIDQLGMVGPGRQTKAAGGPTCQWTGASYPSNTMNIGVITANDAGLGNVYGKKSDQAYFEPTTIDGYPAVYASQVDDRSTGNCALWVGLTDQRMALVEAQLSDGPNKPNPCPITERTAKAMVEHLKSAA